MTYKPWDFMVKDTPSRDWTEGMGVMIIVAFFFGGISGGLYLYSLYLGNLWGMFIGWTFALVMGIFDMVHLHNKKIFWRMVSRPNSSWISRGFLFVTLFLGSAAIQMALTNWAPGGFAENFFKVVAGLMALGVATYSGFVISYVSSIKFWHSTIMPVLFIVSGLAGGSAIILVINSVTGATDFSVARAFALSVLTIYAFTIALQLWISTYNSSTARNSVMTIVRGELAGIFWVGVVFIGILVPMLLVGLAGSDSTTLLVVNALLVLAGNLALRYTILKAGRYSSLLPEQD